MNRPEEYLEQVRQELRIVLLGPGPGEPGDFDHWQKRSDIRDRLRELGYIGAVLGEEILGENPALPLPVALLRELKTDDLILVLNTGAAPLVELTTIFPNQELRQATIIFCPRHHLIGRRTIPGDVVRMFTHTPFNDEELVTCELTEEFVAAANRTSFDRAQRDGAFTWLRLPPL